MKIFHFSKNNVHFYNKDPNNNMNQIVLEHFSKIGGSIRKYLIKLVKQSLYKG